MAETRWAEMKRYVRWIDADAAALRVLGAAAAPRFRAIAEEFYDRTREHEGAHAVFTGEEQIERLKRSLVDWLERLCAGPHDDAYFEERSKIGRMHVKIGLPQRYMFTGMALLRGALQDIAATLPGEQATAARRALARLLDLELAIMLETYHEDLAARLTRLDRDAPELARARSEHRYARAIEQARILVVGLDAQGCITLFNAEAEHLTGWARDEVLGRSFAEMLLPSDLAVEEGERLRAGAAGKAPVPSVWETALRTRAGKTRNVRWQLSYAPDPEDPDVAVFAVGQDVTGERLLLERTVQNEKLAAVGTLAAGLAHEIRNPLNGALLHVTFLERALKRAGGDPDALEAAGFIGAEIRRLSTLVKEFLVFARPAPLELQPTPIDEVCRRAAGLLGDEAAAGNTRLVLDLSSTELVVTVDAGRMEQVILNLVKNAIDAVAETGGGQVIVRTRRAPRHAVIEVEDDGAGLPSPEAPVFDAFFSTKPHGTGLGLAIVHRVVTDHGGTIEVESRAGQTVFRVTLPLAE